MMSYIQSPDGHGQFGLYKNLGYSQVWIQNFGLSRLDQSGDTLVDYFGENVHNIRNKTLC